MQLHPAFITTLINEHERELRNRADKRRTKVRHSRPSRRAPWIS